MANKKQQKIIDNALKLVEKGSNTLEQPAVAPLDENAKQTMAFLIDADYAKEFKKKAFAEGKTMSNILDTAFTTYLETIETEAKKEKKLRTFKISEKNSKKIREYASKNEIPINTIANIVIQKYLENTK